MAEINIKHLEKLAKLDLPEDEERVLVGDLKKLCGLFEQLAALDVGVATKDLQGSGCSLAKQALREDKLLDEAGLEMDQVLDQAPHRLGSAFGVPRVL